MASLSITTDRTVLSFGKTPFTVRDLRDRASGVSFLRAAAQSLIVRTPTRVSDPFFLTVVEEFSRTGSGARMVVKDESGAYRAELVVTPDQRGLKFTLAVTGPVPLWMVEWKLTGLQLREVIIPALGGQSLGSGMPPETALTYKYPFWWNAQFVIGVGGRGG
ncbi:hypothetical protein EG835_13035, partial [bacterium]|nr:hypothetical protein [bacterium]